MSFVKTILNFYINSSLHVALSTYALTWITLLQYNITYDAPTLYFTFYATVVAYNFVKYFGIVKYHHRQFAKFFKWIQFVSVFAFLGMMYYALQLSWTAQSLAVLLAIITFLYAIPMVPKRLIVDAQKNLRQISGVKIYVIAFVWACTTVLLPLLHHSVKFDVDVMITFVQRFIYVVVLMLPFEIRDLKYDSLKLATVPQKIGISNTKRIGATLLFLFFLCEILKGQTLIAELGIVLFQSLLTLALLLFTRTNQSRFYTAFWVESLPVLWLLTLLVLT